MDHIKHPKMSTLVDIAQRRAAREGTRVAYRFLTDGEIDERVETLDYRELDARARALAARLQATVAPKQRALLLFPPGLDYVVAFYGCLYANVIAVPAYPPDPARLERSLPRLLAIVRDCEPSIVLTLAWIEAMAPAMSQELASSTWLACDRDETSPDSWSQPELAPDDLAFLQYTSGSTGTPRGVAISHANLAANAAQSQAAFGLDRDSVGVSWLPPYHDMGLMGTILQPMFTGYPGILMPPHAFLQRPLRWLAAMSHYGGTISGGPNFAYELCTRKIAGAERVSLDLSPWRTAFNGAEPVRADTLDRFTRAFAGCGLRRETLYPCYGLAETTLFATGGVAGEAPITITIDEAELARLRVVPRDDGRTLVGCGRPWLDQEVRIVDPETRTLVSADRVGEIWLRSGSRARGYWGRPELSRQVFEARLAHGEGSFLRTGDLGFMRDEQLYVSGRIKDVIVIRGRNLWPQDIEHSVERCHAALRPGGSAAFALELEHGEGLGVLAEVRKSVDIELAELAELVRRTVIFDHGVRPDRIALIPAGALPKTSSGKVQRFACRAGLVQATLTPSYELRTRAAPTTPLSLLFFSSEAEAEAEADADLYGLFMAAAQAADRLGFEALWIPERHFHPFGGLFPNPATLAAAVAATTERVKIRAGSVVMPLHDPLRVAEEWSVVDRLSKGRVGVAFAIGWNPNDYVLAPARYADRKAVTYAGIDEVRRLWQGEAITRKNGRGEDTEVRVFPRPLQVEIPLWLTCSGSEERFIEAGERGFNVLTALLFQTPELLAERIAAYRSARARVGLDPAEGHVTLMLHTFVAEDAALVDAAVEQPLIRYLASSVDLWRQRAEPLESLSPRERESVLAYAAQRYRRNSALIGTPEACARMLERVRATGADEIACLIDFGVESRLVLDSLPILARLGQGELATGPEPSAESTTPSEALSTRSDRHAELIALIANAAAEALSVGPEQLAVEPDTTIDALGLDSLHAVELSTRLGAELGLVLPATILFQHGSVAELAAKLAQLEGSSEAESPQHRGELDLRADIELPADIDGAGKTLVNWSEGGPRRVLLTGATGFLGAFVLAELLQRTQAEVVCLVRASSPDHGARRLRDALTEFGLWNEAWRERCVPLLGDLAAPGLGLEPAQLDELASKLDAIIHNGALVNFAYTYATCRAANVLGTVEVLRLACRGPRLVPIHHISTTAVFSHAFAGQTVGPTDEPSEGQRLDMGYTQTKWVAEQLVVAARARGLAIAIDRPGLITGAHDSGACHLSNFVWNLIRVSVEIGVLPDYDRVLDMTPVDWAAAVIVDGLCARDASRGVVRHLVNQHPISLAELAGWLRERGHTIEVESFERWQIRVIQRVTATPALSALLPVLSLAASDFYERRQVRFDAAEAAAPFEAAGRPCPPLDRALLDRYHDYFVARAFLPTPGRVLPRAAPRVAEALDLHRLHDQVVQITGLSDLGPGFWREPFAALLQDMRRQSYIDGGLERATMRLVTALIRRAQIIDLHHRHPEIAKIEIPRPLIIAAPPRTGTTLLHNLLAQDPANSSFALWEMLSPVTPRHATQGWTPHMVAVADELVAETYERSPALRAIHPLAATAPDECHWMLSNSMTSLVYAIMAHAPEYTQWLLEADMREAYHFYRATQQALLWRQGRDSGQRLVAKDPWHLWHLETLLETHPDAQIVLIHRDMCEVVPSRCSLARELIRVEAEPPAPELLGRASLDLLAEGASRMQRVQHVQPESFINLDYRTLVRDPLAAVESIYAAWGQPLEAKARARMQAWLQANPKNRHGRHRYSLADFGLREAEVRERFAGYEDRFSGS